MANLKKDRFLDYSLKLFLITLCVIPIGLKVLSSRPLSFKSLFRYLHFMFSSFNYINKLFYPAIPVSILITFSNMYDACGNSFRYTATEVRSSQVRVDARNRNIVINSFLPSIAPQNLITKFPLELTKELYKMEIAKPGSLRSLTYLLTKQSNISALFNLKVVSANIETADDLQKNTQFYNLPANSSSFLCQFSPKFKEKYVEINDITARVLEPQ